MKEDKEMNRYLERRFDPTIYFIRGIARIKKVHKSIKLRYDKDKNGCGELARQNSAYNSRYLRENDYEEEQACLMLLGILTHYIKYGDKSTKKWLLGIIKRAYPVIFEYVSNNKKADVREFFFDIVIKKDDTYSMNMKSDIGVFMILCALLGKEIAPLKDTDKCTEFMFDAARDIRRYYNDPHIVLDKMAEQFHIPADTAYKFYLTLNSDIDEVKDIGTFTNACHDNSLMFDTLTFLELVSTYAGYSIDALEEESISDKELMDLCKCAVYSNCTWELAPQFILIGMYSLAITKKYQALKDYCSKVVKKLDRTQPKKAVKEKELSQAAEISKLKEQVVLLQNRLLSVDKLQDKEDKLKLDNASLSAELSRQKEDNILLRDVINSFKTITPVEKEKILPAGSIVIGGHINWVNKLSMIHTDVVFADGVKAINACKNKKLIIFKWDFLSHKVFTPCIEYARTHNIPVAFISGNSDPFIRRTE